LILLIALLSQAGQVAFIFQIDFCTWNSRIVNIFRSWQSFIIARNFEESRLISLFILLLFVGIVFWGR